MLILFLDVPVSSLSWGHQSLLSVSYFCSVLKVYNNYDWDDSPDRDTLSLACGDLHDHNSFFQSDLETLCTLDDSPEDRRYDSVEVCSCRGSYCNSPEIPDGKGWHLVLHVFLCVLFEFRSYHPYQALPV